MKRILLFAILGTMMCWVQAQNNSALQINSDGTSFFLSGLDEVFVKNLTIEGWVKIDNSTNVDNYTALVDFRNAGGQGSKALIFKTLGGEATTSYEWNNNWGYEGPDNIVPKGEWVHVAVVIAGDDYETRFYINGEETGVDSGYSGLGDELPLGENIRVGAGLGTEPQRTFVGLMDEIRIWTVARTEEELRENLDKEIDPQSYGLLMYFKCNEDTFSDMLHDATGNGYDLPIDGNADHVFVEDDVPFVAGGNYVPASKFSHSLSTYPNPVAGTLNFNKEFNNSVARIYNVSGQMVKESMLNSSNVNVASLDAGIYILNIIEGRNTYYGKFIKE